jgi:hypothetical protein
VCSVVRGHLRRISGLDERAPPAAWTSERLHEAGVPLLSKADTPQSRGRCCLSALAFKGDVWGGVQ